MSLKALTFLYQGMNPKDTGLPLWRLAVMAVVLEEDHINASWREVPYPFELPRDLDHASVAMEAGEIVSSQLKMLFRGDLYEGKLVELTPIEMLSLTRQ